MPSYVKNPETGRKIKVDGPTYLKQEAQKLEKPAPMRRHVAKKIRPEMLKQMEKMPLYHYKLKQILSEAKQPHVIRRLVSEISKA